jgi:methylthioribose-1-phosphate isomerase
LKEIRPIQWSQDRLWLLDQTKLPLEQVVVEVVTWQGAATAIRDMQVRGAPAIGVTAGYAVALAARSDSSPDGEGLMANLARAAAEIAAARPTAVNLQWAVKRMLQVAESEREPEAIRARLLAEAKRIQEEDETINRKMGELGKELIPDGGGVLTHCNTGALATSAFGTALGVIRAGWESGRRFQVFNTETRPFLQGARLTSWEFQQLGIPSTLLVDSAAGMLMRRGGISCVITGADRIAANGDTANKIGTYSLAVLAKENDIPFYVAAPTSTVDLSLETGDEIQIEERPQEEVTHFQGVATAPPGVPALNPSFDVTPSKYITAIVTEEAICRPPYPESLRESLKLAAGASAGEIGSG